MIGDDLGLTTADRAKLEKFLLEFDEHWNPAALADAFANLILEPDEFCQIALLELIKIDLHRHWEQGDQRQVDSYLPSLESIGIGPTIPAQLILAEFLARHAAGKEPSGKEYQRRFPDQFAEFKKLFDAEKAKRTGLEKVQTSIRTDGGKSFTETQPETGTNQQTLPESFGRYKILRQLGAGAMGAVYLANDTQLDRQVALKTPSFGGEVTNDLVQRFYREARAAANLRHPNICTVFDVGEIDGRHYITMDYVDGRPLSGYIGGTKPLEQKAVAGIVRKLALALADAHQAGVIHRDLKPDNVMVDQKRQPLVMDFGLARRDDELQSRMTQPGTIMGTPAYMSPEQVKGQIDQIGPQADIYSLGIMLYELLTGKLPFDGSSVAAVFGQILTEPVTPPSQLRADTDRNLEAICLKMVAKEQSDRYATMNEVASDLAEYVKGNQTLIEAVPPASGAVDPIEGLPMAKLVLDPSPKRPTRAWEIAPSPKSSTSFWKSKNGRFAMIGAAIVGLILVVLSVTLIFRTPYGMLTITIDDPDIIVEVDGKQITIRDDSPIRFKDGSHELALRIGNQRLPIGSSIPFEIVGRQGKYRLSTSYGETELLNDQFKIDKGDNSVLTIGLTSVASDKVAVPVAGEQNRGAEWTKQGTTVLERQAAEWVLTNGGSLMISVNGAPEVAIKSEAALPRKNFQIEGINLRDTKIGDASLAHVKRLTNLHSLNLVNTQIGDAGLAELKSLTDLQFLWLTNTPISDAGLAQLKGMKNLQRLVLNISQIGDAGLAELRGLTNLQELDLSYTRVSDAGLAELKGLTNLQRLWLQGKKISDASLVHLKELTNLRFLDLHGTKLTDAGLAALKKALPRCQVSRR